MLSDNVAQMYLNENGSFQPCETFTSPPRTQKLILKYFQNFFIGKERAIFAVRIFLLSSAG